jgi:hypothetical protein
MSDLKEVVKGIEWVKVGDAQGVHKGQLSCFSVGERVGKSMYTELVKRGVINNEQ